MAVERTKSIRKPKPVYKTSSGETVPGVTTILSLRAKEALIPWAFNLARDNPGLKSVRDYVDDLADIGKCAHAIIGGRLTGIAADLSDFTPNVVEAAAVPVNKFIEWERGHKIQLIASEKEYVSDQYRYGGTLDLLAKVDGALTVLDLKTGKAIYPEMLAQTAAYAHLVGECGGLKVDAVRILQIGRTGSEGFTERTLTDWSLQFAWFLALRQVYQAERDIDYAAKYGDQVIEFGDPKPRGEIVPFPTVAK